MWRWIKSWNKVSRTAKTVCLISLVFKEGCWGILKNKGLLWIQCIANTCWPLLEIHNTNSSAVVQTWRNVRTEEGIWNVHQFGLQYLLISANIIINFQVSGQSTSLRKNDFSRDCVSSAVAQGWAPISSVRIGCHSTKHECPLHTQGIWVGRIFSLYCLKVTSETWLNAPAIIINTLATILNRDD